jgi:hypothetical protein
LCPPTVSTARKQKCRDDLQAGPAMSPSQNFRVATRGVECVSVRRALVPDSAHVPVSAVRRWRWFRHGGEPKELRRDRAIPWPRPQFPRPIMRRRSGSSVQFSRTFTKRKRCTRRSKDFSSSSRASCPRSLIICPPLPSTMAFWLSRST